MCPRARSSNSQKEKSGGSLGRDKGKRVTAGKLRLNVVVSVGIQLMEEREGTAAGLLERQQDLDEHLLVLKTLKDNDGSKKAWRLVGDVLVERTVDTVLPEVIKNKENLELLVDSLKKKLENKTKEIQEFEKKYNISVKKPGSGEKGDDSAAGPAASSGQGQGVIVQ